MEGMIMHGMMNIKFIDTFLYILLFGGWTK